MGDLHQDTRTVAGIVFATAGATMIQPHKGVQGHLNGLVGSAALYVDDKPDAAGIVFVPGIVQALRFGPVSGLSHPWIPRQARGATGSDRFGPIHSEHKKTPGPLVCGPGILSSTDRHLLGPAGEGQIRITRMPLR